jgi:hypothetical protein
MEATVPKPGEAPRLVPTRGERLALRSLSIWIRLKSPSLMFGIVIAPPGPLGPVSPIGPFLPPPIRGSLPPPICGSGLNKLPGFVPTFHPPKEGGFGFWGCGRGFGFCGFGFCGCGSVGNTGILKPGGQYPNCFPSLSLNPIPSGGWFGLGEGRGRQGGGVGPGFGPGAPGAGNGSPGRPLLRGLMT